MKKFGLMMVACSLLGLAVGCGGEKKMDPPADPPAATGDGADGPAMDEPATEEPAN